MLDVDQQIRNLKGPLPPEQPPDVHGRRAVPRWPAAILAAAAGVLLFINAQSDDSTLRERGAASDVSSVDLRLFMERDSQLQRLRHGERYETGQRVFFSVSRASVGPVFVWASGPDGLVSVGNISGGPQHQNLASDAGAVAYQLEQAGTYTFYASSVAEGACDPDRCDTVIVEVH